MAEATRLMSICGISEEEAQYYLQIGDRELATAYRLFLLAKSDSPLTLESTAAICGFSPFELMVNPNKTAVSSSQIPTRDLTHWKQVPFSSLSQSLDKCVICMCEFTPEDQGDIVQLAYCSEHYFHSACIEACRGTNDYIKCPICGRSYGLILGDMPPGSLVIVTYPCQMLPIDGYPDAETVIIQYSMPPGERNGARYSGTQRTAFFPSTAEGREVIRLLILAFERKLTFVVGTSITTGRQNAVVWNGIHHKTNVTGGPTRYGYPDPGYFFRVKEELLSKGLTT